MSANADGCRIYFTNDDGNAARPHTSSFHLGRFCDRLAARGRGLLARTHLLIRRPGLVGAAGAWLVNTTETETIARAAIVLADKLRDMSLRRRPATLQTATRSTRGPVNPIGKGGAPKPAHRIPHAGLMTNIEGTTIGDTDT